MDSISFVGGDNRNLILSQMFSKEKEVYTFRIW